MTERKVKRTHVTEEIVKFFVAPCFKCEETGIRLFNYEDNHGPPLQGGECPKCRSIFKENGAGDHADAAVVWNKHNDPVRMIEEEKKVIEKSRQRIREIQKIKYDRLNLKS